MVRCKHKQLVVYYSLIKPLKKGKKKFKKYFDILKNQHA